MFLLPGALAEDVDALATGLANSLTLGVGQFCTNPGLVILPEGPQADRFLEALAVKVRGCAPGTMLGENIQKSYEYGVGRLKNHTLVTRVGGLGNGRRQCGVLRVQYFHDGLFGR